jgi:hypothetical protein
MVEAADTREAARAGLVDGWDRKRQAEPDKTRIILTHTNAEVRELNQEARGRMRATGELGTDTSVTVERGRRDFAAGDRIMFLRNERSMGVKNGTLGTLEQVNEGRMAVRLDGGNRVAFDLKDYAHVDHGYAATIHKSQGLTVDRAHVLATPGMDRHGAYVALSRHRDGVALHYGRDDFADQRQLARTLSRDRAKDMAGDYPAPSEQDRREAFAERREIRWPERAREIATKVRDKAQGMFAGFKPKPATPSADRDGKGGANVTGRGGDYHRSEERGGGVNVTGQAKAIERYARAAADIERMKGKGLPVLPHQESALRKAGEALEANRPHAARDLASALRRDPRLIEQAAGGNTGGAVRAMAEEQRVRLDPDARAGRFVEAWKTMQRDRVALERAGDRAGAERMRGNMAKVAGAIGRDPQLESALRRRAPELELKLEKDRAIGDALAVSIGLGRERDRGLSR